MSEFLHLVLLGLSVSMLVAASSRAAAAAQARGLERAIAAAPIAASAAVVEALALGLLGLGTTPAALALAALATWALTRRLLPAPETSLAEDALAWWERRGSGRRVVAGCLAGAFAGWTAALLHEPVLGNDSVIYHLAEMVAWVHSGRPGTGEELLHGFPVGNYPLTNEVLVTWFTAQARSFVPVAPLGPGFLALLAAAGWVGLRELGAPAHASALAIVAVCVTPLALRELEGPNTDLPATAWLAAAAALVVGSRTRPALLAPALLALGLSVGTKTTTAVLALALAGAALVWRRPRELRPLAIPLALAGLAALVAGGAWYLRNLIQHGSPLWPFVALPWSDPPPPAVEQFEHSLLERPRATLAGRLDDYANALAGGWALIAAGTVLPLLARTRRALLAAAATALGLLAWMNAPITGAADRPEIALYAGSATRYLLPVVAAGALATALASVPAGREPRRGQAPALLALAALGASAVWSVVAAAGPANLQLPAGWIMLPAILAGGAAALLFDRLRPLRPRAVRAGAALAVVASAGALAAAVPGYTARHADAGLFEAELVRWFAGRPGFDDDRRTIAMGPVLVAVLAGDRLERRLELLPSDARCSEIVERLRGGQWIVLKDPLLEELLTGTPYEPARCELDRRPVFEEDGFRVYSRRTEQPRE